MSEGCWNTASARQDASSSRETGRLHKTAYHLYHEASFTDDDNRRWWFMETPQSDRPPESTFLSASSGLDGLKRLGHLLDLLRPLSTSSMWKVVVTW